MHYVDVILPLPLEGTFTYSVPEPMVAQVRMGVRVLVPLGRSKTYTAMAVRLHSEKPEFETRPIIQVIDAEPVLIEQQLRLWQWISTYYMVAHWRRIQGRASCRSESRRELSSEDGALRHAARQPAFGAVAPHGAHHPEARAKTTPDIHHLPRTVTLERD